MALTFSFLKAVQGKPRDKVGEFTDREGLSVRVSRAGKTVFQLRYRYQGKPARIDIGSFPGLSLADARTKAQRYRHLLEQGFDPRVAKHTEKQTIQSSHTIESLYMAWHEAYCVPNKKVAQYLLKAFQRHVFPSLGAMPTYQPAKLTAASWLDLLDRLAKTKPAQTAKLLNNAKQMYEWAVRRGMVDENPITSVTAADLGIIPNKDSGRALSDDEISQLYRLLNKARMHPRNKVLVHLLLFYGCRPIELREARQDEFDLGRGVWTIPAARTKTGKKVGKALTRPIIDPVKPLLDRVMKCSHDPALLCTNLTNATPMSKGCLQQFSVTLLNTAKRHGMAMKPWTVYDLRKTARTHWAQLTEPHVAEMMLGHALPGMWSIYNKHDYLKEMREAYGLWWDKLERLSQER